jgi:ketosteroid isomerase-like protein
VTASTKSSTTDDAAAVVAALDTAYQAAVKANDADAMGRILTDDMVVVLGNGAVETRQQFLDDARSGRLVWEYQDELPGTQEVRVWGDTAVVTAKLRIKGKKDGVAFDRTLWFSDTYVRTPEGWRYAFGQASLPLP